MKFLVLFLMFQSPWVTLAPEGAGFSVSMPGEAVEAVARKPTFTLHSFTVTAGRATYVASYSDYQPGKLDPTKALTANRDKFNKSLHATLLSSREITLDGHAGIEFTSETPAANLKSQLFLIGDRMFQTAAFVFKDVDETRNVDRFFESFKFTTKANEPGAYLTTPARGLDALAYSRFGIRPAR
jgi:hypothetical protein